MKTTLLLDLDDTLLANDINAFLPAYFKTLGKYMANSIDPGKLVSDIFKATQAMIGNQRPDRTLMDCFEQAFYPAAGLDPETTPPIFEQFYHTHFPALQPLTSARPAAIALVEEAKAQEMRLAVATNPLFPLDAMHHRLNWAGLSVEEQPFELVTAMEAFHFAKPNPAYFAEILAQMGWPEGPVVMVGDDPERDIAGAQALGIASFLLADTPPDSNSSTPIGHGSLADVLPWIANQPPNTLIPQFSTPTAQLALLRGNLAGIISMLAGLNSGQMAYCQHPESWNITQVLCHLRDVDREVYIPRLQKVLNEENAFIEAVDTDAWAAERAYLRQDGAQALQEFIAARLDLLDILDNLPAEKWQRRARHTIFGPTSIFEMVSIGSRHDRLHVQQIHTCCQHIPINENQ